MNECAAATPQVPKVPLYSSELTGRECESAIAYVYQDCHQAGNEAWKEAAFLAINTCWWKRNHPTYQSSFLCFSCQTLGCSVSLSPSLPVVRSASTT